MNPIDLKTARKLVDFSGGDRALSGLSKIQIEGAVALQNMIVDPNIGFAYLADEVGMGKTYIALFQPHTSCAVYLPQSQCPGKVGTRIQEFRSSELAFQSRQAEDTWRATRDSLRKLQKCGRTPTLRCFRILRRLLHWKGQF